VNLCLTESHKRQKSPFKKERKVTSGILFLRMGSAKWELIRTGFLGIKAITDFSPEETRDCF